MAKQKEVKTNAMRILEKHKISYQVYTYDCEEFLDGISVANLIGKPHDMVYKTLVAIGKSKEHYVFLIPIAGELELKKAAKAVGEKSIEMLPLKDLTAVTGYIRGGCTAVGMKKQFVTVFDETAKEQEAIMVSGGKRGVQIELKPGDLKRAANAMYADVLI